MLPNRMINDRMDSEFILLNGDVLLLFCFCCCSFSRGHMFPRTMFESNSDQICGTRASRGWWRLSGECSGVGLQRRQMTHSNNFSCSLSMLLAAFFRFYAYDLDYKKQVVLLNASRRYGRIERESKAETDMWKSYGQACASRIHLKAFMMSLMF